MVGVIEYSFAISAAELFELRHDEISIMPIKPIKSVYEEYFMFVEA